MFDATKPDTKSEQQSRLAHRIARLADLEAIAAPDDAVIGSIQYETDCIRHLRRLIRTHRKK